MFVVVGGGGAAIHTTQLHVNVHSFISFHLFNEYTQTFHLSSLESLFVQRKHRKTYYLMFHFT